LSARAALEASGALSENVNYAVKSSFLLSFLESVPEVSDRLKELNTKERKFEDIVKDAEKAAALVQFQKEVSDFDRLSFHENRIAGSSHSANRPSCSQLFKCLKAQNGHDSQQRQPAALSRVAAVVSCLTRCIIASAPNCATSVSPSGTQCL
jgi:hypothetical protein